MFRNFVVRSYISMCIVLYVIFFVTIAVLAEDLPTAFIDPMLDPGYPKPGDKSLVEQTVNGITVRIINLKKGIEETSSSDERKGGIVSVKKQVVTVDFCFTTPDSGEWMLYGEGDILQFKNGKSNGWYGSVNWWDEKIADGKNMGEKCGRYHFAFDLDVKIEPPLILTFQDINSTPREWLTPCEELMKRVETNPRAQEAGLKIGCENVPNAREDFTISVHDATPVLAGYDRSRLTKQEAHALMLEIQDATVYGPWIFKITPTN